MKDEVAEEDDDEVVVCADETAEEADVLSGERGTTMASITMSSLCTSAGSILPCILLLRRFEAIIFEY